MFIALKKAFDTVDYNILLSKLYHYCVKGSPHQCFKSGYLTGWQQYTTIKHQKSNLSNIKYGVPQGSLLGATAVSPLYLYHSLKNFNKTVNFDLCNLVQWLRANEISLNINKAEIVVFRSPTKQIYKTLSFRLSGQKIERKRCTTYLEVIIDEHL